jgi:hypothetical protein
MRKVFVGFAALQLLAVILQFYLATFGAFETPHPAPGSEGGAIQYHAINGTMIIPIVSLLTTIVAALARAGGRLIGLSIAPLALVAVQLLVIFSLAEIVGGSTTKTNTASLFVLGFHSIDGLVILWAALTVLRGARALARNDAAVPAPAPVASEVASEA